MSMADKVMKEMLNEILEVGTETKNAKVRPVWADTNEPAFTKKVFGVTNRYYLNKEFPAGTLRKLPFKNCVQEMLWIWQMRSNRVSDLGLHIWDQWTDKYGKIGKAYGYQIGKYSQKVKIKSMEELKGLSCEHGALVYMKNEVQINGETVQRSPMLLRKDIETEEDFEKCLIDGYVTVLMNQIDYVIHELKWNPQSRRIIANMYNIDELDEMNLHPCAYSMTFNVTEDIDGNKYLNAILNQRSLDTIVAGAWNVAQYAALVCILAQCCDMKPGTLLHVIADAHIYDRHEEIARELISRRACPAPTLWINPEKKNFFDFTVDDIRLENYKSGEQIKNIPVAK